MRKAILFIFLFIISFSAYSQCDCSSKFNALKHEIETNYAGYKDKVIDQTRSEYEKRTKEYADKAHNTTKDAYCYFLLREWLKFFKDGHVQLYPGDAATIREKDTAAIYAAGDKAEIINISPKKIQELLNRNDSTEEGIYVSQNDSTYTVAIIKDKNDFRDFVAVIINSRVPFWKPGQVKLEIKKPAEGEDAYPTITWDRFHNYHPRMFSFGGKWFDGQAWSKVGHVPQSGNQDNGNRMSLERVQSKKLSDQTLYIQIGTFSSSNGKAIDSIFKANEKLLKSMPNLVLDLRHNGGGADFAYGPIIPYIYTDPIIGIGVDVYSTPDNIKRMGKYLENPDLPKDIKEGIKEDMKVMEKNLGKFVNRSEDDVEKLKRVEPFPKKVVILINGNCASTTEQFLLAAKQSKKVTLMGQHTYGELDYSNVLQADLPCKDLGFGYSSTRSRRIDVGQGIDNVGIIPSILLSQDQDWIKEAQLFLEKK